MHVHRTDQLDHDHVYLGEHHDRNARRTWWVVWLTLAMMAGEIAAGTLFGSMALLADGWHMATHAGALGIAGLAYAYARRHARSARFSFGTGKVGDLAGFASALIMAVAAIFIAVESVQRMFLPVTIAFDEAIAVAVLGLAVNLISAALLGSGHEHRHQHAHDHHDDGHAHSHAHAVDQNLRAAYLHVLADALTSIAAGDPVLARAVRAAIEVGDEKVNDLHLWRVGPGRHAAIVSLVTAAPLEPDLYKQRLAHLPQIVHVSVEAHRCPDHPLQDGAP